MHRVRLAVRSRMSLLENSIGSGGSGLSIHVDLPPPRLQPQAAGLRSTRTGQENPGKRARAASPGVESVNCIRVLPIHSAQ